MANNTIRPATSDHSRFDSASGVDTVRAVVMTMPGTTAVHCVPEPVCGPDEVLVAVSAVGLCGSDLAVVSGHRPVPSSPWVVGHEGGGTIVAVGTNVTTRTVGERVVIEPNLACGTCRFCAWGRSSACPHRVILGVNAPGIAAERVAVPAQYTHVVSADLDARVLACIEPWVVTRTAVRRAGVRPGDRCLVVGAGSQGQLLCLSLLDAGAQPVIVEPNPARHDNAVALGAEPATGGEAFPVVFETSGAPAAFPDALAAVERTGTLLLIGQSSTPVAWTTAEIVQRQITVIGSLIYDHPGDFAGALAHLPAVADRLLGVLDTGTPAHEADRAITASTTAARKSWLDLSRMLQT